MVQREPESVVTGSERSALKEWAVLADALGRGDIIAMVRKGGIREQRAGFSVRHSRFLLYPTFFHEKNTELAPRFRAQLAASKERRPAEGTIRLELVAQAAAVWRVTELELLRGIGEEHGLAWEAVESRFRYRNQPVVHVVALRVSRLASPVELPEIRRYQGCVSWVQLDRDVVVADALQVLELPEFERRCAHLEALLGTPVR